MTVSRASSRSVRARRPGATGGWWARLPRAARLYLVAVVGAAALGAAVVPALLTHPAPTGGDLLTLGALAVGLVVHVELAARLTRGGEPGRGARRMVGLESAWGFAAVLLVPSYPALLLVAGAGAYSAARHRGGDLPARRVAVVAAAVLGSVAATVAIVADPVDGVLDGVTGSRDLLHLVLVVAVRWGLATALIVGFVATARTRLPRGTVLDHPADAVFAGAGLVLGLALATLTLRSGWLAPVVLLPLLALEREAHLHQLRRSVRVDATTGLARADHWHVRADAHVARLLRARAGAGRRHGDRDGATLLMIDIDRFKAVNDRHGHVIGDRVLRAVAGGIARELRRGDLAGRFGGEEFAVLLTGPGRGSSDAQAPGPGAVPAAAERLRCRVGALRVPLDGAGALGVTVSIGVARFPEDGTTLDALLRAADLALYDAKDAGRDRVRPVPRATPG